MFGLFLAIVVLPAVFRYLTTLLESRANGATPPAPGIECGFNRSTQHIR